MSNLLIEDVLKNVRERLIVGTDIDENFLEMASDFEIEQSLGIPSYNEDSYRPNVSTRLRYRDFFKVETPEEREAMYNRLKKCQKNYSAS